MEPSASGRPKRPPTRKGRYSKVVIHATCTNENVPGAPKPIAGTKRKASDMESDDTGPEAKRPANTDRQTERLTEQSIAGIERKATETKSDNTGPEAKRSADNDSQTERLEKSRKQIIKALNARVNELEVENAWLKEQQSRSKAEKKTKSVAYLDLARVGDALMVAKSEANVGQPAPVDEPATVQQPAPGVLQEWSRRFADEIKDHSAQDRIDIIGHEIETAKAQEARLEARAVLEYAVAEPDDEVPLDLLKTMRNDWIAKGPNPDGFYRDDDKREPPGMNPWGRYFIPNEPEEPEKPRLKCIPIRQDNDDSPVAYLYSPMQLKTEVWVRDFESNPIKTLAGIRFRDSSDDKSWFYMAGKTAWTDGTSHKEVSVFVRYTPPDPVDRNDVEGQLDICRNLYAGLPEVQLEAAQKFPYEQDYEQLKARIGYKSLVPKEACLEKQMNPELWQEAVNMLIHDEAFKVAVSPSPQVSANDANLTSSFGFQKCVTRAFVGERRSLKKVSGFFDHQVQTPSPQAAATPVDAPQPKTTSSSNPESDATTASTPADTEPTSSTPSVRPV